MLRNRTTRGFSLVVGLTAAILAVGAAPSAADVPDDTKLCDNASKDLDAAVQACTRLLESGRTGIKITNVLNARGLIWFQKREYDRAIRDFDETINRDPKNASAYRFRGIAWFQKGELDRAIVDYNKAIDLDATPAAAASAYKLRGIALTGKGEFERAIADFDRSVKLDGRSFSTYKYRGEAWLRKRDYDRALADFNHAIRLAPKDPDRYNDRAQAWLDKGDFKRAVADYDEAIRLNPTNWRAYSSRGEARRLQGEYDRALADHDEAIRLDPKAFEAYINRALVYRDKGDFDAAIADSDEAILLNPSDARAHGNRGEIWRLKNDIARSLKDLDKAVSLAPKSAMLRCRRGDTLREIGETDRALAEFNEAILISPNSICAYVGRGQIFEQTNEFVRAKTDFEKALALQIQRDPDPDTGKTAQETARARLPVVVSLIKPATPVAPPELAAAPKVDPGVRMALVIGNSAYRSSTALVNPRNDAQAVADTFRRIGFKSVRLELDLDREKLTNALRSFARESAQADWAVVYYAGHGIEVSGVNYLIPIDAKLETDRDVEFETVPLDRVMTAVDGAKKLRLVILDACRDNPFVRTMTRSLSDRTRSIGRGLAKVEPDSGNLIVYAARHGQVALDGKGDTRHSPFAAALIKNLQKPGIEIRKLFDLVRDDVMASTKRAQQPFTYGSVPGAEDFYFVVK